MLMNADHSCGIAYESVSQLRDVNEAFFLDSQIDEAAKICDVGHNAGKYHPSCTSSIVRTFLSNSKT